MESETQLQNLNASLAPNMESLALGGLMMLVVANFRAEFSRSLPALWGETTAMGVLPIIGLVWVASLIHKQSGSVRNALDRKYWIYILQVFAILFALIPAFLQPLLRGLGLGDAYEVVAVTMLANGAWFLTIFSRFGTFERAAFALSGVLVLFICFMSRSTFVFAFAMIFAAISLWWLIGNYWNRVSDKAIDADSKSLPVRGMAITIGGLLIFLVGLTAASLGPIREAVSVAGFMPASGGDSGAWQDALARSGIGDGNMITAGPNASTGGAVDSDQFIEDDKPSIYDISAEKYNGPMKIRKQRNRAIALDVKAKHMEKVIQSEQSGRSFRTLREHKPKDLDLKDRITDALLYIEGSVPARFAVDCFWHFDGHDWTKGEFGKSEEDKLFHPEIRLEQHFGKPWCVIPGVKHEYVTSSRAHRVKFMRLKTNGVPSPALIKSWHISRMNTAKMFRFDKQGMLRMDGEFIATHTMIDMVSHVPNYHILRKLKNPNQTNQVSSMWDWMDSWVGAARSNVSAVGTYDPREKDADSLKVQVPDNDTRPRLKQLAEEWTQGHRVGWPQVEAIVNKLRSDFKHDVAQVADPECNDTVGWFLDNGAGPSYLFATTATQILRAAGYKTRLVTGFLVQQDDYDRVAQQSIVTSENFHMWPEVCVDGKNWLPVEPTPGFPIPYSHQTIWQWCQAQIGGTIRIAKKNPIASVLIFGTVGCSIYFRKQILVFLFGCIWQLIMMLAPSRRLKMTRRLIDLRFWAAGAPRPGFVSVGDWFSKVAPDKSREFLSLWYLNNFSSDTAGLAGPEVATACRDVADGLSIKQIKKFISNGMTTP